MKRLFVTVPMMLPRLSDRAAAQLLEILALLHESMQHHYGPQAKRWQDRQRQRKSPAAPHAGVPLPGDEPF